MSSKIPSKSLTRLFAVTSKPISRTLCAAPETQAQKLSRIADQLLDLNKLERYRRHRRVRSCIRRRNLKAAGKTAFDIKLEKFDASAKIKIIKEVRTFTDLGLKEAKELVEKASVVIKKGLTKEEATKIVDKLKELGATAVLE